MLVKEISLNKDYLSLLGTCMSDSHSRVFIGEKDGVLSYMFVDYNMMIWLREKTNSGFGGLPHFSIEYKNQRRSISKIKSDRITLRISYEQEGEKCRLYNAFIPGAGHVLASFYGSPFAVSTNIRRPGSFVPFEFHELAEKRTRKKHWDIIKKCFKEIPVPSTFGVRGRREHYATWQSDESTITCVLKKNKLIPRSFSSGALYQR